MGSLSFDHLVGQGEQRRGHLDAKRRAVCRLMINSNLVGCMTGRSAGFSPLYGALEVKHLFAAFSTPFFFLLSSFFVRLGIPFLRPDPHIVEAVAHRGCQGRPSLCAGHTLPSFPGRALADPSTTARWLWSG